MSAAARFSRRAAIITLAAFMVAAVASPSAAQFGFLRGNRDIKYRLYRDSANLFQLEYPEKDWRIIPLPIGGNLMVQFSHKDGATFIVEHIRMPSAFTAGERAAMAEGELERVRSQERATKDFKSETIETRGGSGILIRYQQVGRGPERVVQCTIDIGVNLFRLNGVMPERLFAQFEPIVLHMIESFKSPAEPPVPAK